MDYYKWICDSYDADDLFDYGLLSTNVMDKIQFL